MSREAVCIDSSHKRMPGMDGFDVAREIKRDPTLAGHYHDADVEHRPGDMDRVKSIGVRSTFKARQRIDWKRPSIGHSEGRAEGRHEIGGYLPSGRKRRPCVSC